MRIERFAVPFSGCEVPHIRALFSFESVDETSRACETRTLRTYQKLPFTPRDPFPCIVCNGGAAET